jgi:Coenzyme PQQ synthesis protein D (PqqD)
VNAERAGSQGPIAARWAAGADVIVRRTGDTAVIVDLRTNRIFELNPVAARVWELLADSDEATLLARLGEEFDVDGEQLRREVETLLSNLQRENLITRA